MVLTNIISALLLVVQVVHAAVPPEICMIDPVIMLKPGAIISARLQSEGKRCEATLTFTNPDFLPLRYGFSALDCLGFRSAEFTIPPEVPNGDAFILWQCADQSSPTCTRAVITEGTQDIDKIQFNNYGRISCLVAIATDTTLLTSVGSTTTATLADVTTIFSTLPTAAGAAGVSTAIGSSFAEEATPSVLAGAPSPSVSGMVPADTSISGIPSVVMPSSEVVSPLASDSASQPTIPPTGNALGQSTMVSLIPTATQTITTTSVDGSSTTILTLVSTLFSTSTIVARSEALGGDNSMSGQIITVTAPCMATSSPV